MTDAVVEVSCRHTEGGGDGAHLVYRGSTPDVGDQPYDVWSALADAVCTVARLVYEDQIEVTDECGW